MLKKSSIIIVILCILLALNILVTWFFIRAQKQDNAETMQMIETLDKQIRQDESIIDSLENIISLRESLIDSLSFMQQEVHIEKIYMIQEVRELPLTESVEFLKEKLKEYEEEYENYLMFADSITP